MRTDELVLFSRRGPVARLTLNRPEALNALSFAVLARLAARLDEVRADARVRVVVLCGASDRGFSAGADIPYLHRASPLEVRRYASLAVEITRRIEAFDKPVIAALHGYTVGGGLEIAEACALRIAADDCRLGHPEVQIGAVAGFGGTTRLPRLIGRGRAAEWLLTGRIVDAQAALEAGLVNEVVPRARLLSRAEAIAREIAVHSPESLALTWEALHRGQNLSTEESARLGADFFGLVAASEGFREGTRRWLERDRGRTRRPLPRS